MLKSYFLIGFLITSISLFSQEVEVAPPYNIKTISFIQNNQNNQNTVALFQLGDSFQLQFDDLYGNEANYYYKITLCDYDWKPSQLSRNEYMNGFDEQRLQDETNSVNDLQIYTHYRLNIPNKNTQLRVSGNYMLSILDENKTVVFSRKFILYEDMVSVPMQVRTARVNADIPYKQNLDFAIKTTVINFQNPLQNVKVLLLQNGNFNTSISNIKPMYTLGNDLIYKYDKETQFWGGNEFLYFDNKTIRVATNSIVHVDTKGNLYNCYLYPDQARANRDYTYYPDVDGNFVVNNSIAENNEIEADYAWIYFSLSAPAYFGKKNIYVTGMFNNYALTDENKMDYDPKTAQYTKAIMIKQGFTNYQYTIADDKGIIDQENAIDGNFNHTENNYFAIVYYRENGGRYDRVIGRGIANSTNIMN